MSINSKAKTRLDDIEAKLEELAGRLNSPETEAEIKSYLKAMSQFHSYSINNVMSVMMEAMRRETTVSRLASFKTWTSMSNDEGDKVKINKGSKGFTVLVPIQLTRYQRDGAGNPMKDGKGNKIPVLDEKGKPEKYLGFTTGSVFDVNQTNALEIGAIKELEYRNAASVFDAGMLQQIADRIGEVFKVPVTFEEVKGGAKGFFSPLENRIVVDPAAPTGAQLSTLMHELGHAIMHKDLDYKEIHATRGAIEGEAEAFGFVMSDYFGIENKSELYIKSWGNSAAELKERFSKIGSAVKDAFKRLDIEALRIEHEDALAAKTSIKSKAEELKARLQAEPAPAETTPLQDFGFTQKEQEAVTEDRRRTAKRR